MCRAGKQHWSGLHQQRWTDHQASPVAPAVTISRRWLKWRVRWRNTWLLIAGTCEYFTFFMLHTVGLLLQLPLICFSFCLAMFLYSVREDEWEQDCSELGRRHHSLPPVSPYRCRRQAVLDLLFDDVWQQLVGWMKELVQRHWECCTSSRAEFYCLTCIRAKLHYQTVSDCGFTRVIGRWWKAFRKLKPCAARLPESLHAALLAAHDAAQTWPEQSAPAHSWPAVPGQWAEVWGGGWDTGVCLGE